MKMNKLIALFAIAALFFSACQKAQEAAEDAADVVEETADDVVEAATSFLDAELAKAVIDEAAGEAASVAGATAYSLDLASSKIEWKGNKVAYGHNGTIDLKSGSVAVNDGMLVGGEFVIDMNTITDLDVEDAEKRAGLEAHLKGTASGKEDDFFNVTDFPEASFAITKAEQLGDKYMISGNLTIKGITHQITFPAEVDVTDSGVTASAAFSIDRTKWNVNFNSGNVIKDLVADQIISDDMGVSISLATAAN